MKFKFVSIILLLVLIINVFTGCSSTDDKTQVPMTQKVTNVYKSDVINLPNNITMSSSFVGTGDKIYVIGFEIIDLETYEIQYYLYSFDQNGENMESQPIEVDGVSYINKFAITSDGCLIFLCESYDIETEESITVLSKYSSDGELIFSIDPTVMFNDVNDSITSGNGAMNIVGSARVGSSTIMSIYVSNFTIDGNDNIYISSDDMIAVLSPDGEKLYSVNIDCTYLLGMNTTVNGDVYIKYYDATYNQVFQYIDNNNKSLGKIIEVPSGVSISNNPEMFVGTGYNLYLKNSTGLYGYNYDDGQEVLLCDWINSDINSNSINDLTIISADKLIYSAYDDFAGSQRINILTRVPDDEVKEKYIITIASLYNDNSLTTAIINFNKSNDEYRVIIKDYSNNQDQLNMDIVNGNMPDIVYLSEDMPLDSYINKGMFVDLYSYLDNDPDISRETLLNCVRQPFEHDGKLYQLFTSFSIQTLAGKTANVGSETSWTVNDVLNFINNMNEGKSFTDYDTRETLSEILLSKGLDGFIDYENGTCNFESQEFIDILNYLMSLDKADYESYTNTEDYQTDPYKKLREDDAYVTTANINSFTSYLQLKFQFNFEDITLKGYPSSTGNGTIITGDSYAISSKSLVKDGAWQFLKYLISDELQTSQRFILNWPSTVNGIEYAASEEMKREYSFYYSGGYSATFSSDDGSGYAYSMISGGYGSQSESVEATLTQDIVDELLDFLNSDFSRTSYTNEIYDIINEEVEIFFEGSKSAEETAKVIQSRTSIYISENS